MRPNWFIGLPAQVDVELPAAPSRVRIFAKEDRHITVAFLGAVDEERALAAWNVLRSLQHAPIPAALGHIKLLGNRRKPSAVTALASLASAESASPSVLERLIGDWRTPLFDAAGAPQETRPPLPHVTLARVQRKATADEYTAAKTWAKSIQVEGASFTIDQVALYTWATNRKERLFQIVKHRAIDD